jgi:hypothetical protein
VFKVLLSEAPREKRTPGLAFRKTKHVVHFDKARAMATRDGWRF